MPAPISALLKKHRATTIPPKLKMTSKGKPKPGDIVDPIQLAESVEPKAKARPRTHSRFHVISHSGETGSTPNIEPQEASSSSHITPKKRGRPPKPKPLP